MKSMTSFGDGIFGKKLQADNVIRATHKTDGKEGNGVSILIL